MDSEQKHAIYSAYLGVCVLQIMCRKAGLSLGEVRAKELLIEMGNAFPFIMKMIAKDILR
jgi:hypothetical protein